MEDTKVINETSSTPSKSGPDEFKIEFPAESEYVSVIRLTISGLAARIDLPVDIIDDIKVAVSEACTNVIQHAYNGQGGKVYLNCKVYEDKLAIEVEDTGDGFEIDKVKSADQRFEEELDETQGLGLGLTFIKTLMDDAEITSKLGKGTVIKMVKNKPGDNK